MTKAITGVACMQLVEQGKLQLDQPMGKLLPQLEQPMVLEGFDASGAPKLRPAKRAITLRHLLTHTAGFTYSIWSEPMARFEKVTGTPFIGECKNATFNAPLLFDPGDRWEYGINIDWVGKAVEAVTNQSLETYLRTNVFEPLQMRDSGFILGPAQRARRSSMHRRHPDGALEPIEFELTQDPEFFMGGGGLYSTGPDYLRFLRALLGDGELDGARILQSETVDDMFRNHIGDIDAGVLRTVNQEASNDHDPYPGMPIRWGLGFMITTESVPGGRAANS